MFMDLPETGGVVWQAGNEEPLREGGRGPESPQLLKNLDSCGPNRQRGKWDYQNPEDESLKDDFLEPIMPFWKAFKLQPEDVSS